MSSVKSTDGTVIAYDEVGAGLPVILVGGAFSYRKFPRSVELAELLGERSRECPAAVRSACERSGRSLGSRCGVARKRREHPTLRSARRGIPTADSA